jgi:DNA-binding IclR family transcriptional regulator
MDDSKDRQFVTALARGLDILRCFDRPGLELAVSDLARTVKLPQPTVWRLCHTLLERGFLVKSPSGRLKVGAPALTLGYVAVVGEGLPALALPYMQALTDRSQAGTSLSVRDGLEMIYIQRRHGDFVIFNQPVGARNPISLAPTGWAYLAAAPVAEREAILLSIREADPVNWPTHEGRIAAALQSYAAKGYIISDRVMHEQFSAIAVPIVSTSGARIVALSCGGLASTWSPDRLEALAPDLFSIAEKLAPALDAVAL